MSLDFGERHFVEVSAPPPPVYIGYRGLHMQEGGRGAPVGMPAVLPPIETRALAMNDAIQRMSYNLARYFAPTIDGMKWRAMHGDEVAMNNGTQNGFGTNPHRDIINSVDLSAPLPRYDKMQRSFAGTFIRGEAVGGVLYCTPGIHGIDSNKSLPSVDEIVAKNWYVIGCTSGEKIFNLPYGGGKPVVYPFIFDRVISFPLAWFEKWEANTLPEYLKVYRNYEG